MSKRYPGGLISKTSVVPTRSSAPGVWTLDQAIAYTKTGTWPIGITEYNWVQYLGATASANFFGVAIDSSGFIYAAMNTGSESGGAGNSDGAIVKYDSAGNIQWQKLLGSAISDDFQGVAVDSSSNVYVVGSTVNTNFCILIAKYNTSGTLQWQRRLGGASANNDTSNRIAVDSSGNVYITGSSGANQSILTAKYDTNGNIQWQRTLNGAGIDYGDSIAVDSAGNVYITGYATGVGQGNLELIIAKYDTLGNLLFQRTFGGGLNDQGTGIVVDSSGNIYICGNSPSGGVNTDLLIAKYNTSGTLQWQRVLSRTGNDYSYDIALDSFNNLYISGGTDISAVASLIVKYDTNGNLLFQRILTGVSNPYGIAIDNLFANISMCVVGDAGSIIKLPNDGSKTGTYGSLTYSVTSAFANSEGSFVNAAASLTNASSTLANGASTLTDNNGTMTVRSKTNIL
jgi:outer membrane protein assembly factor BamB